MIEEQSQKVRNLFVVMHAPLRLAFVEAALFSFGL
jgi:hypothetical protein